MQDKTELNTLLERFGFSFEKIQKTPLAAAAVEQYSERIISRGQLYSMLKRIDRMESTDIKR